MEISESESIEWEKIFSSKLPKKQLKIWNEIKRENREFPDRIHEYCHPCMLGGKKKIGTIFHKSKFNMRDAFLCKKHYSSWKIVEEGMSYHDLKVADKAIWKNGAPSNLKISKVRVCDYCKIMFEKMKKCSRCKVVYYCSVKCQKNHWKIHKKNCK